LVSETCGSYVRNSRLQDFDPSGNQCRAADLDVVSHDHPQALA
jgi:hypothetical protein